MKKNLPLFLLIFVLIVYILMAGRLKFQFPTDPANYFSHLAVSFLDGRLDLINPSWDHDLSLYKDKLYLYWGPTPTLLIIPFVYLFGVNISDVLYTAVFAAVSPLIIYLIFTQLEKLHLLKKSLFRHLILTIFFAFGTVYFSVAVRGGVWFTSQVFSTLYVLISIYLLLYYINSKRLILLFLSSIFLGLGIWGRLTFIFYMPIFFYFFNIFNVKLKSIVTFFLILVALFSLSCVYNYARFGSIWENGFNYHKTALRYAADRTQQGYFNLSFVPHNFYYTFINPPQVIDRFPFFNFDGEGNSFLILSPLFLITLSLLRKKYWAGNLKTLNRVIISTIILIVLFQLIFFGTGWFQFSARYLLDIIPALLILLAMVLEDTPKPITLMLLAISIYLNILGALWLIGVLDV